MSQDVTADAGLLVPCKIIQNSDGKCVELDSGDNEYIKSHKYTLQND